MRMINLGLDYLPINLLFDFIDEPNRRGCRRMLAENRKLFELTPGSTHNHQAWPGGYIDHLTDAMNTARHFYELLAATGRELDFSISDALLVLWLHDVEKPWKYESTEDGRLVHRQGFNRDTSYEFRLEKAKWYGIVLTDAHCTAIKYAEGIVGTYTNRDRVTNPLGAFVHAMDHWSARGWYDYPKPDGVDEWEGAGRFRSPI